MHWGGIPLVNVLQGKNPFEGTLVGNVREVLNPDDPSSPAAAPTYGTAPRFQPDFAAGAANMAAKPRFGPNAAQYGPGKFNDVGERFGMGGAGFDPMMRQRMLSQNLRGPQEQSPSQTLMPSPMPQAPAPQQLLPGGAPPRPRPQPGMGGGGFSQMMNNMGGGY